jgi:hypothetical protein
LTGLGSFGLEAYLNINRRRDSNTSESSRQKFPLPNSFQRALVEGGIYATFHGSRPNPSVNVDHDVNYDSPNGLCILLVQWIAWSRSEKGPWYQICARLP